METVGSSPVKTQNCTASFVTWIRDNQTIISLLNFSINCIFFPEMLVAERCRCCQGFIEKVHFPFASKNKEFYLTMQSSHLQRKGFPICLLPFRQVQRQMPKEHFEFISRGTLKAVLDHWTDLIWFLEDRIKSTALNKSLPQRQKKKKGSPASSPYHLPPPSAL